MQFDGRSFLVGCAVVGCIALFDLGVYNGHKDTKDQKINRYRLEATFL